MTAARQITALQANRPVTRNRYPYREGLSAMNRLLVAALLLGACLVLPLAPAADSEREQSKEALKALQDYIGAWKGNGGPLRPRPGAPIWNETLDWSWRFKGNDAWLALKIEKGKHFKSGELRYRPDKKVYQLTVMDARGKKRVFEGS